MASHFNQVDNSNRISFTGGVKVARCLGYEYNGVFYDEMPDEMWEKLENAYCRIHGLVRIKDEEELSEPDDPPAA